MEPAPLPPHERPWRHPSELGPRSDDVDAGPSTGLSLMVASGAVVVALVAAVVISMRPAPASSDAASATTVAVASAAQPRTASPRPVEPSTVRLGQQVITIDRTVALTGAPSAVSSKHVSDPADLDVAVTAPPPGQSVVLLTTTHTFVVDWSDLERIEAPDGSVVVSSDGELLATFVSGELRVLVD